MASFAELGNIQANYLQRDARLSQLPGLNALTTTRSDSEAAIRDYRKKLKDSKTSWSSNPGFERKITGRAVEDFQRGTSTFEGPDGQLRGMPTAVMQKLDYAEAMGIPSYAMQNIYKAPPKGMYGSYAQADYAMRQASENPFFQGQGAFDKVAEAKRRTEELLQRNQSAKRGDIVFNERAGGPSGSEQSNALKVDLKMAQEAERRARKNRQKDLIQTQTQVTKAFKDIGKSKPVFANVPIKETIVNYKPQTR